WRWSISTGLLLTLQFYLSINLGYMAVLMLLLLLLISAFVNPSRFTDLKFLIQLVLIGVQVFVSLLPLAIPYYDSAQRWGYWSWSETLIWMPTWQQFFTPIPQKIPLALAQIREEAVYWGYGAWILYILGTVITGWQLFVHSKPVQLFPIVCSISVLGL